MLGLEGSYCPETLSGGKTLEMIHRLCMAHQHIPLSPSPKRSLICAPPTHSPFSQEDLTRFEWISSPLIRT